MKKLIKKLICKFFHKKFHAEKIYCDSMGEWKSITCTKCDKNICL